MSIVTTRTAARAAGRGGSALGRRAVALTAAVVCHGTFAVAVAAMFFGLWNGMRLGRGPLSGGWAWAANTALIAQFPLLHSFLLSRRGGRVLAGLVPGGYGRTLAPTTFATVAAAQALVTFALWSPSGVVLWEPPDGYAWLFALPYGAAWVFLLLALKDGGIGLQSGAIGWLAVWRGEAPRFGGMPTQGTFAMCRQPIYLGFALTLWTGPVWTADHLFLAVLWTLYCAIGPVLKERRFAARYGDAFEDYRARTPYFLPRITR